MSDQGRSNQLQRSARANQLLFAFFSTLLILALTYRLDLLLNAKNAYSGFGKLQYASVGLGLISDLLSVSILTLTLWLLQTLFAIVMRKAKRILMLWQYLEIAFLYIFLLCIALIFLAHQKLFLNLAIGFTYSLFVTSLQQGFLPTHYAELMQITDWVLIVTTIFFFTWLRYQSSRTMWIVNCYLLLPAIFFVILTGLLSFVFYGYEFSERSSIVYSNPLEYAATDLFHRVNNAYFHRSDQVISDQLHSVALIDPDFVKLGGKKKLVNSHKQTSWNIVLIVLESVGASHLFDTAHGESMPMPFLHALSKKSLWLNNNYSTGNTSSLSAFGLLTGLYSDPSPSNFSVWPNLAIPTMAGWLDEGYEKIFVTAGVSRYYFPEKLVKQGFNQFYDGATIPGSTTKLRSQFFLDEQTSVDFFLSRLDTAKQPFIAGYWSGAAHFPYYDYGDSYQVRNDIRDPLSRYENNLNLLDHQLQRIYQALEKKKWLDHTIIVIVGDHGDSFGEHAGIGGWMHGSAMYQEQIKTPLLFYQPKIFKPRVVNQITSSIDILPTVLDAMHVSYDASLMQGESLLNPVQYRKYVFVYGDEDALVAIDRDNQKMQISFSDGSCSAVNLNDDPHELHPLECKNKSHESTIIKFRNYQAGLLHWYNRNLVHL